MQNITKACDILYNDVMKMSKVATVMRYYTALCNIRQRLWKNATDQLETASFMQYAPAVELVWKYEWLQVNGKMIIFVKWIIQHNI